MDKGNKKYDNMDLLNSKGYNNVTDVNVLRETFKVNYAVGKGWDVNTLTDEQLNEIKSQKGYQSPGMICG